MKNSKAKRIFLRVFLGLIALAFIIYLNRESVFVFLVNKYFSGIQKKALEEGYQGIQTSEGKIADLFPIQSTGVSTAPIQQAAADFLSSLSAERLQEVQFDIQDDEWQKWSNIANGFYVREGISLAEMTADQKEKAFQLMAVSLSAKGLQLSKDIMKTDQTLKEFNDGSKNYGEELYYFTFMGEPSQTKPWGWQLDGHHLVINYFVLGDQVVMSPAFLGAEPAITTTGKYKGNTLFQDEQNLGLAFMKSLSSEQQEKATLAKDKPRNNNVGEAHNDNLTLDYEGIKVSEMTATQKGELLSLASQYISNMREGHSQVKMSEIEAHIDDTWFAWVGGVSEDAVFYYRIHSPVVLIEFDHQSPVAAPAEYADGKPIKNHIHTLIRTPNGNDYGKDLLRQHLEEHHH